MKLPRLLLCLLPALPAPASPVRRPVAVPNWVALEANIAYDRYPQTALDIMRPKAPARGLRPGVIMFHGGGWIESSNETMMTDFCLPYLERGFVVCNVEYRFASAAPAPAAVTDALDAARWFFAHASGYGVDPARIVVTGASAGGHLALMVGLTPAAANLGPPARVAAIVNGFGITDVAELLAGPHHKSWAAAWVPAQPGRLELARRVSPLTYVRPGLPPLLTVQGANDTTVPLEQGVRLTQALRAAGDDAELIIVPHAKHGFSRQQWPGVNAQIFAFLKKHGILR